MLRRLLFAFMTSLGLILGGPVSDTAVACPMCKTASEDDEEKQNVRPRAYMYSILFMLAVPATIATGFGIGFWRLSKKRAEWSDPDLPG